MQLEGRAAIVTGGAGGLGSATVRRLVDVGMKVVVFDLAGEAARALADELGDGVAAVAGDACDDDAAAAAVERAGELGVLSLVANVGGGGVAGGGRTIGRDGTPSPKEPFVLTMEMNATATFNMSRLAAAAMARNEPDEEGERGVIVNTGSIAGLEGQTGQLAYAAAKAAILGMTLPMARDQLVQGVQFPRRLGKPEEFAQLVEMIARNPYLNGENIRLDGALRFPPK